MERKAYIENNDDTAAVDGYLRVFENIRTETENISPAEAYGRVTSRAVFALKCDPTYNAAAMDGIAVTASDTFTASEELPLELIRGKDFEYISTGGAVTGRFDAVIMIEDVLNAGEDRIRITAPAYPWQHVRVIGESVAAGEMILPSRRRIRPQDIGALVASGNKTIEVFKKPRVGIIPTGAEMTEDCDELSSGKLMESNSRVFSALCDKYDAEPNRYSIVPDDIELLKGAVRRAVEENDLVIVNAGSSAGTKDFTVKVISELGRVIVHGVAVKPGKPTILGIISGKPVIGIPGYPVSAYLIFEMFAKPVIFALNGVNADDGQTVHATLTRRISSSFKNAELVRMAAGEVGGRLVATPLDRGAAAIMTLVKADALLRIDRLEEGVEAGAQVELKLLKPLGEVKKSLVITGSHDMIIDVIADKLPLSSAHVGSMGGISALMRGECHIAPIHLLDEKTGEYNVSYVEKYFSGRRMALIRGVGRVQGFVVEKGNPKGVDGFSALRDKKLAFANRQRGAGTRILLDYELKKHGLAVSDIKGYEKEFGTHLGVAAAVKNGVADTGLAVLSAARALDLDFVPIANERYDFLTPYEYLEDTRVKRFLEIITSQAFCDKLEALGGYTSDGIGGITVIG